MFHLLLPIIYISFISLGLPDSLLGSAWPSIYPELNVPVSGAGVIAMIISAMTVISSLMSDRLTRTFGTGKVTAFSVAMTAAALYGFSVSHSYAMLLLWAIPYGLGAGSVDASLNNYVALYYESRHMSWLHCMWGIGTAIGPNIMGFALTRGMGWNAGYRIIAVFQTVLSVCLFLSLPLWKSHSHVPGEPSENEARPLSIFQIVRIPGVREVIPFGGRDEKEMLRLAACLEEHFAHPIASAIVKAAKDKNILHPEEHAKVEYIVAHGIATTLHGKNLLIGSRHFIFEDEKCKAPADLEKIQKDALENGMSLLYLAEEKTVIGIFAINDPVRENAAKIIKSLHESGIKNCVMITGDDEGAAKNAAKLTNIDHYISRALPEDKVEYVKAQKELGHKVIMIGDGINDAPALSAADTGIAMGDCADITGETADIVLSADDGLLGLYKTRALGSLMMKKIDSNNKNIVAVNTTLMFLGLFGIISPSLAAVLHNASTVAFSVNAMKPLLGTQEV